MSLGDLTTTLPERDTNTNDTNSTNSAAISQEQAVLDEAFHRRDELLQQLERDLEIPAEDAVHHARMRMMIQRRSELTHADSGLIFGRLDALDKTVRHLGRVGIPGADADNDDPLVIDWRASAARAFYTATAVDPQGQARRRHIRTRGRDVMGVDDEPLDGSTASDLVGEGALLAALDERRTGQMGTAAATLQREQDDIIRADARGPLVVQGGPGTGKTVVALHRVAYLLFTHSQLAAQGVLVLGPSTRFLDYIAQVLPALGETAIVSSTCDTLVPGIRVERDESRDIAEIKGRALWQKALAGYAASLVPQPVALNVTWEGERYSLNERRIANALASATSGRSYHAARAIFSEQVHDLLTDAVVERSEELLAQMEEGLDDILSKVDARLAKDDDRGVADGVSSAEADGVFSEADIERLRDRVSEDDGLAKLIEQWWPVLDAQVTLRELLDDDAMLRRWAPDLTAAERQLIVGESAGWASSDIPLIDALSDALGDPDTGGEQTEFLADRAASRRDWVYGHVVIDEAQELSEMQWQMVMRRCPSQSITAVGDIDQAEAPHRHMTWEHAVGAAFGTNWTEARLTICYRTPLEVMALTAPVLRHAGSRNEPPRAVRASGIEPWERNVDESELVSFVARAGDEMAQRWTGGTIGVIAPQDRLPALRAAMPELTILSATDAKGLEWDATLLVDAAGIAAEPRGWNGLYVALTRCTQELGQLGVR